MAPEKMQNNCMDFLPKSAKELKKQLRIPSRLARISHQFSTAAADPGMSTALRSVGLLDILSSMPAGPSETYMFTLGAKRQAPYPSAPPRYENW
jgi:hypothetical protein